MQQKTSIKFTRTMPFTLQKFFTTSQDTTLSKPQKNQQISIKTTPSMKHKKSTQLHNNEHLQHIFKKIPFIKIVDNATKNEEENP
jgi:hypothetical protein